MSKINTAYYNQRPLNSEKIPKRIPLTEQEYYEQHPDILPGTIMNTSSSDDSFSLTEKTEVFESKDSSFLSDDFIQSDVLGKVLSGEIGPIASEHFKINDKIQENEKNSQEFKNSYKYPYFTDLSSSPESSIQFTMSKNSNMQSSFKDLSSVKLEKSTKSPMKKRSTQYNDWDTNPKPVLIVYPEERKEDLSFSSTMELMETLDDTSQLRKKSDFEAKSTQTNSRSTDLLASYSANTKNRFESSIDKSNNKTQSKPDKANSPPIINVSDSDTKYLLDMVNQDDDYPQPQPHQSKSGNEKLSPKVCSKTTFQFEENQPKSPKMNDSTKVDNVSITIQTEKETANFRPQLISPIDSHETEILSLDTTNPSTKNFGKSEQSPKKNQEKKNETKYIHHVSISPIPLVVEFPSEDDTKIKLDQKSFQKSPDKKIEKSPEITQKKNENTDVINAQTNSEYIIPKFSPQTRQKHVNFQEKGDLMEKNDIKPKENAKNHKMKVSIEETKDKKKNALFIDPHETKAQRLRNQSTRQKLALLFEQEQIKLQEEEERKAKERRIGKEIGPSIRKANKESAERQKSNRKFSPKGSNNDPKAVEGLKIALENAQSSEMLIRRDTRGIVLQEIRNKRQKNILAQKNIEPVRTQKRREANERYYAEAAH